MCESFDREIGCFKLHVATPTLIAAYQLTVRSAIKQYGGSAMAKLQLSTVKTFWVIFLDAYVIE